MGAAIIANALEKGKDLAAALGMGGVLWSAYSVSGLPIPATIAQVDQRIVTVTSEISGLKADQLDGQRAIVRLTRVSLRNEESAIGRMLENLDTASRVTMNRRLGEIRDELKALEDQDADLRGKLAALRK